MTTQPNTPTVAKPCPFCYSGRHNACDGYTLGATDTLVRCPCRTCTAYDQLHVAAIAPLDRTKLLDDALAGLARFEQSVDELDLAIRAWVTAKAAHDLAWEQSRGVSGANLDPTSNAVHEAEGDLRAAILDAAKVVCAT